MDDIPEAHSNAEQSIAVGSRGTLLSLIAKEVEVMQASRKSCCSTYAASGYGDHHLRKLRSSAAAAAAVMNNVNCNGYSPASVIHPTSLAPPASSPAGGLVSSLWSELKGLLKSPTSHHLHRPSAASAHHNHYRCSNAPAPAPLLRRDDDDDENDGADSEHAEELVALFRRGSSAFSDAPASCSGRKPTAFHPSPSPQRIIPTTPPNYPKWKSDDHHPLDSPSTAEKRRLKEKLAMARAAAPCTFDSLNQKLSSSDRGHRLLSSAPKPQSISHGCRSSMHEKSTTAAAATAAAVTYPKWESATDTYAAAPTSGAVPVRAGIGSISHGHLPRRGKLGGGGGNSAREKTIDHVRKAAGSGSGGRLSIKRGERELETFKVQQEQDNDDDDGDGGEKEKEREGLHEYSHKYLSKRPLMLLQRPSCEDVEDDPFTPATTPTGFLNRLPAAAAAGAGDQKSSADHQNRHYGYSLNVYSAGMSPARLSKQLPLSDRILMSGSDYLGCGGRSSNYNVARPVCIVDLQCCQYSPSSYHHINNVTRGTGTNPSTRRLSFTKVSNF